MKQPEILVAIGSVIAVAASATLPMAASAATNITGTVTLTDDADWTAHGKVTIASGATLDLDGHTLKVAGLDGEGTIASGEGFSNLTTDPSKATCSDGIASVDSDATAACVFNSTARTIVQKTKNGTTYWPFSATYDFGTQTLVNQYRITATDANNNYASRAPGSWAMWGSNDNETWTIIGSTNTCASSSWNTTGKGGTKSFVLNNAVEYRYYKIEIHRSASPTATSGNYIEFKQLQFGRASAGNIIVENGVADASSLTVSGSVSLTLSGSSVLSQDCDLRPFGTSLSVAEGATIDLNGHKLYASSAAFANNCTVTGGEIGHDADLTTTDASKVESDTVFAGGTTAANLFNNNYERKTDEINRILVETRNLPLVVTYDFGEGNAQTVDAYRVWTGPASGSTKRTPSAWRFEGSNDKADWTPLDSRHAEGAWQATDTHRTYSFTNSTAYRWYRMTITGNNGTESGGKSYLELVQLEYFHLKPALGELHLETSSGDSVELANLSLTGNLRLFVEGAGTVRLSKTGQTYVGGTELCGGTVLLGSDGSNSLIYGDMLGEEGGDVVVHGGGTGTADASNAILDFGKNYDYTGYKYVLAGGTIQNSGDATVTELRLDANSYMKATSTLDSGTVAWIGRVGNNSYYKGFADLGGHDLSVRVQTGRKFGLANTTLENGGLKIIQGGWFTTTNTVVATNNVLVSVGCAMDIGGSFAVSNYTYTTPQSSNNSGASDVDVYGTFTPNSSGFFHGSTMHDGSIIDLSNLSTSLNAIAPFNDSTTGAKTLHFVPGATVGVRIGGRKKLQSTPVITWTASEKPDPSVKFVRADADLRYSLVVKDDGLYYVGPGLIISFH